ncbi:MAG: hypothetical protein ACRDOE_00245 [Streptosporangiaceae bacterium]
MTMQRGVQPGPGQQPAPPAAWRITAQREVNRLNASGQYVSGVLLTFQTAGGLIGTAFVPDAQYTAERVKNLVNDRVAAMEAVQGLQG